MGQGCNRGVLCSFAHSQNELKNAHARVCQRSCKPDPILPSIISICCFCCLPDQAALLTCRPFLVACTQLCGATVLFSLCTAHAMTAWDDIIGPFMPNVQSRALQAWHVSGMQMREQMAQARIQPLPRPPDGAADCILKHASATSLQESKGMIAARSQDHKFKTEMCQFQFNSLQGCSRGASCTYAHSQDELKQARARVKPSPICSHESLAPSSKMHGRVLKVYQQLVCNKPGCGCGFDLDRG